MVKEYPRFTRAVRAFATLDRPNPPEGSTLEERLQWDAQKAKERLSWADIRANLETLNGSKPNVVKLLNRLRSLALDMTGGDQSKEIVDEAAAFLLHLFLNERIVTQKHLTVLRQTFGFVTPGLAEKACECVMKIRRELPDELPDYLSNDSSGTNRKRTRPDYIVLPKVPDLNIYLPDTSSLVDLTPSVGAKALPAGFSMGYEAVKALHSTAVNGADTSPQLSRKTASKQAKCGLSWLEDQIKKYDGKVVSGFSTQELCDTILMMLKSTRSNEELQNELFDLLGFDSFELIEALLQHRNNVLNGDLYAEEKKQTAPTTAAISEVRRPAYGCNVIVQTEKEIQMLKQVRKDEKRLQKHKGADDDDSDSDFDPLELRAKRIAALEVKAVPALTRQSTQRRERYPNVYDSRQEALQTSGFICGVKMVLPVGVDRIDTKKFEEVNIPVTESAPLNIGNKFVQISSLDEIGQMAFQGVKQLNRIQSMVFDTAYHTNENLLICAPTGAGKTNVAMLTIIHQLRQHMDAGVIKKDQFKIVYVAPMKALAAEMTQNFGRKLGCLGISVRELTGDMQLTKSEMLQTQMVVTTPEKWDVITRKSTGDIALTNLVKLLIIDEVHLLHGDRGPVIEALVARTLRQVETSQSMIRIVGLSATLPNYLDVARFLRVNPHKGLFYFDSRFRPVPLGMTFIGVKAIKPLEQMFEMDNICYDKVVDMVQKGHQVMVFVHARNATARLANVLKTLAGQRGHLKVFEPPDTGAAGSARNALNRSRNKQLAELFAAGFSIHHAGMLREDRSLVEKYFGTGLIKVLVCTSTLAWGVNLPAHAVIIRGTEIYDAKQGSFVDLGILDVLQIFGRAGRPQFDKSGHGTIITSHDKLAHYLSLLTNQFPIESSFIKFLADNLNAEIVLGTISNVSEAVNWLSYTYLYVRMRMNPQVYGINYQDVMEDQTLEQWRLKLITTAANALDKAKMIRYEPRTGSLSATDLGRTASHFYIKYDTVEIFNELMAPVMSEADALAMISKAQEFDQLKVRDDELEELDQLIDMNCPLPVAGGTENVYGKVNILLQTFLSHGRLSSFSLISDQSYVMQNAVRILRALFEIQLRRNNAVMATRFLTLAQMFEQQQWNMETPMRQFRILGPDIIHKIDEKRLTVEKLRDMDAKDIGILLRHGKMGHIVKRCAEEFPMVDLAANLQPITRTVLRIRLQVTADFRWNDKVHGRTQEAFYIWIEDPDNNYLHHWELFLITKKQVIKREPQELVMTIPLSEPLPSQYIVRATSDRWLGSSTMLALTFQHLILPETHPPHTDLLPLQPLPVTALNDPKLEMLYNFTHFNPIQTQVFHCLYHTDNNVLLGAPTGSGKTICAEIAMFRVFREYPGQTVVYIAPLKALVRERVEDWRTKLGTRLGKSVIELTGDVTPDARAIANADVVVTTPEKWDGVSRSWQTRGYVQKVALVVIDEIHLLGEDRGPVLEVIVSRTGFISSHTERTLRIIGLSTALANASDLAAWLEIGQMGLYNFRPAVRPVPLEVHISGFPGKHYCPRMATMNRPTFQAIQQHSPDRPALVFVSSRRQTRLTALDLIAYLAAEDQPKQWLHLPEEEMDQIISGLKDPNLKLTLAFGIGLHHAGLQERDRKTVEELFVNQKIQILIATATLAWGVNFPAHLVVIKGTEYYDGKQRRYVDMPITDVLQMMGRAGRPQFDENGVAVVLVHDIKKNYYKKFLYEPFPVESSLLEVLPDHINAEIVAGTIRTKQDALDYLTWTYFFRRLLQNPSYYNLETLEPHDVNNFLSGLVQRALMVLADASCVTFEEDQRGVTATSIGRIASYYYLSYKTMLLLRDELSVNSSLEGVLRLLSNAYEYDQMPVRHNEDILNGDLAKSCPLPVDATSLDSPHTKTLLLLQAHFSRLHLPCADYHTDLKSVLDQALRIVQAMIDMAAEQGWLATALRLIQLMQMVVQARWLSDSPLTTLPHIEPQHLYLFEKHRLPPALRNRNLLTLPSLASAVNRNYELLATVLRPELEEGQIEQVFQVLTTLPVLSVDMTLRSGAEKDRPLPRAPQRSRHSDWVECAAGCEATLSVRLRRENRDSGNGRVHCPRFPRGKDEGWILALGDVERGELLALKRVAAVRGRPSHHPLAFLTPNKPGHTMLTLYVMSDSYLGLDQQYDIQLNVVTTNKNSARTPDEDETSSIIASQSPSASWADS